MSCLRKRRPRRVPSLCLHVFVLFSMGLAARSVRLPVAFRLAPRHFVTCYTRPVSCSRSGRRVNVDEFGSPRLKIDVLQALRSRSRIFKA
jgi:hypothetical protein